ncbi:MAG: hypothetical protein AAB877_01595, partial [Patescibacteria group bacterium]
PNALPKNVRIAQPTLAFQVWQRNEKYGYEENGVLMRSYCEELVRYIFERELSPFFGDYDFALATELLQSQRVPQIEIIALKRKIDARRNV